MQAHGCLYSQFTLNSQLRSCSIDNFISILTSKSASNHRQSVMANSMSTCYGAISADGNHFVKLIDISCCSHKGLKHVFGACANCQNACCVCLYKSTLVGILKRLCRVRRAVSAQCKVTADRRHTLSEADRYTGRSSQLRMRQALHRVGSWQGYRAPLCHVSAPAPLGQLCWYMLGKELGISIQCSRLYAAPLQCRYRRTDCIDKCKRTVERMASSK